MSPSQKPSLHGSKGNLTAENTMRSMEDRTEKNEQSKMETKNQKDKRLNEHYGKKGGGQTQIIWYP